MRILSMSALTRTTKAAVAAVVVIAATIITILKVEAMLTRREKIPSISMGDLQKRKRMFFPLEC